MARRPGDIGGRRRATGARERRFLAGECTCLLRLPGMYASRTCACAWAAPGGAGPGRARGGGGARAGRGGWSYYTVSLLTLLAGDLIMSPRLSHVRTVWILLKRLSNPRCGCPGSPLLLVFFLLFGFKLGSQIAQIQFCNRKMEQNHTIDHREITQHMDLHGIRHWYPSWVFFLFLFLFFKCQLNCL